MTGLTRDRPSQTATGRPLRVFRLLSLTPFAIPILEVLFVGDYLRVLTATPPDIVGVPLSLVLEAVFLAWAAIGAAIVWRTQSVPLAQFAVMLFAPTAIIGLVFRPALILLMANLAV
jgi:hypothetical protein